MSEQTASRTLLKSPPELWAECTDAQSLTRHLDTFFGEIRITRLEPENTVAWEGERGRGTVRLEPAGWGTRVTLTARAGAEEQPAAAEEASAPEENEVPTPARPATFLGRLLRRFGTDSDQTEPRPGAPEPEAPASEPPADDPTKAGKVLADALDSLGTAHHRPFSRS